MIWFPDSVLRGSNIGQKAAGCPSFCSRRGENAGNFELWTLIIAFDWYSGGYTQVHLGPWKPLFPPSPNWIACSLPPTLSNSSRGRSRWSTWIMAISSSESAYWGTQKCSIVVSLCFREGTNLVQADQFYVHSPNIFINVVDAKKKRRGKKGTRSIEYLCREWEIRVIWQAPAEHSLNWYYSCCYCYCYYYYYCLSSLTVCRERWRVNLHQVRRWWFGQHVGEFPVGFYKSLHYPAVPKCSQSVGHKLYNDDECLKFAK